MANQSNFKDNRWWAYANAIADRRLDHSHEELCIRVINLMEMAYAIGAQAKEKTERNFTRARSE